MSLPMTRLLVLLVLLSSSAYATSISIHVPIGTIDRENSYGIKIQAEGTYKKGIVLDFSEANFCEIESADIDIIAGDSTRIFSARIAQINGMYQFQIMRHYMKSSRVSFTCKPGTETERYKGYDLELRNWM